MDTRYTFPKKEHLCGDIRIGKLFSEAEAFITYPFRIVYSIHAGNTEEPVKVLLSAPKKRFKKAVTRNRIKRLMREAYRLNNSELKSICAENNLEVQIAFSFVGDIEPEWLFVENKMKLALSRLAKIAEQYLIGVNEQSQSGS